MSRDLVDFIWESVLHLRPSEKLMLLALADQVRDNCDGVCWPSVEFLAKRTCMQVRNAQLILRKLRDDGEITIEYGGQGPHSSNRYRVTRWNDGAFSTWRAARQAKKGVTLARKDAVLGRKDVETQQERVQPTTPQRVQPMTPEPIMIKHSMRAALTEAQEETVDDGDISCSIGRSEDGGLGASDYTLPEQVSSADDCAEFLRGAEPVMSFYEWATDNAATSSDFEAFQPLCGAGALAWKIAICRSVILSRQRVRSLAYCAETLQCVLAEYEEAERRGLPGTPSEDYLHSLVRKIERLRMVDRKDSPQAAAG